MNPSNEAKLEHYTVFETICQVMVMLLFAWIVCDGILSAHNNNPIFSPALVYGMDSNGFLLVPSMKRCRGNDECIFDLCENFQSPDLDTYNLILYPRNGRMEEENCTESLPGIFPTPTDIFEPVPDTITTNHTCSRPSSIDCHQKQLNGQQTFVIVLTILAGSTAIVVLIYYLICFFDKTSKMAMLPHLSYFGKLLAAVTMILPSFFNINHDGNHGMQTFSILLLISGIVFLIHLHVKYRYCCTNSSWKLFQNEAQTQAPPPVLPTASSSDVNQVELEPSVNLNQQDMEQVDLDPVEPDSDDERW